MTCFFFFFFYVPNPLTNNFAGADDVSKYLPVTARLLEEGFSEADVRKIIGENILRVLTQVEQVAAVLQRTTLPSQAVCC